MTQRIIETPATAERDEDLTDAALKRLQHALKSGADARAVGCEVQAIVAEHPEHWTAEQQAAALAYIDSLAEPHKTIFAKKQEGMKSGDIARAMGLGLRTVLKSLAKSYADLLHI